MIIFIDMAEMYMFKVSASGEIVEKLQAHKN